MSRKTPDSRVVQPTAESRDLLTDLVDDWRRERPELDASAMTIVGRILRLAAEFRDRATQALRPYDLHYTDFDVLATLRRRGDPFRLTPTELRQAVLLTSGAMTASLARLQEKGFLTRASDSSDGRVRAVVLTKAGRDLVDEAVTARFDAAEGSVGRLSGEDRKRAD